MKLYLSSIPKRNEVFSRALVVAASLEKLIHLGGDTRVLFGIKVPQIFHERFVALRLAEHREKSDERQRGEKAELA